MFAETATTEPELDPTKSARISKPSLHHSLSIHGLFERSKALRHWPPLGEYPVEYCDDRTEAHSLMFA